MDGEGGGFWRLVLDWKEAIVSFFLAAFFGGVKYLHEHVTSEKEDKRFRWLVFSVKGLVAGCVGLLALWSMQELEIVKSPGGRAFWIAVAGWGGVETMNFFWEAGKDAILRRASSPPKGL